MKSATNSKVKPICAHRTSEALHASSFVVGRRLYFRYQHGRNVDASTSRSCGRHPEAQQKANSSARAMVHVAKMVRALAGPNTKESIARSPRHPHAGNIARLATRTRTAMSSPRAQSAEQANTQRAATPPQQRCAAPARRATMHQQGRSRRSARRARSARQTGMTIRGHRVQSAAPGRSRPW